MNISNISVSLYFQRGIIQTPDEDYVIEPFPSSLGAKDHSSQEGNGGGGGGGGGGDWANHQRPTRSNKRTDDISIPHIMYKTSSLKRNRHQHYFEDDTCKSYSNGFASVINVNYKESEKVLI